MTARLTTLISEVPAWMWLFLITHDLVLIRVFLFCWNREYGFVSLQENFLLSLSILLAVFSLCSLLFWELK